MTFLCNNFKILVRFIFCHMCLPNFLNFLLSCYKLHNNLPELINLTEAFVFVNFYTHLYCLFIAIVCTELVFVYVLQFYISTETQKIGCKETKAKKKPLKNALKGILRKWKKD